MADCELCNVSYFLFSHSPSLQFLSSIICRLFFLIFVNCCSFCIKIRAKTPAEQRKFLETEKLQWQPSNVAHKKIEDEADSQEILIDREDKAGSV